MDKNRFDGFTRQLAKRENRRQAIKTLFAGGAATAATVLVGGGTDAKVDCCPADHPTLCGLTCTDTIYDEQNCGTCGTTCGAGQQCYKGNCEADTIVHCATVADCPGSDSECAKRTCKLGVCGVTYGVSGKKVTAQDAGDCQKKVCDGAGNVITIVDNTDKPADQGECWVGICVSGVPHQNTRPSGRLCSNGKCDGSGNCVAVACTSPNTCPGTDTECATRTCVNGACGMSFTASGTPTSQQTAYDCKQNVCDGAGKVITVNDDNDFALPYYTDPCVDSICSNGSPAHPFLGAGTACIGGGGICDGAGHCVQCLDDSYCPPTGIPNTVPICASGNCFYQCLPGYTECVPGGAGCVNMSIDPNHCGSCDHACSIPNGNAICANGACSLVGCNAGYADCNNDPADGCETNTRVDDNNCGTCANKCTGGTHCTSGTCI